jgi:aryl-alcohol dehydrogenase-like predicted oxidoreductase
LLARLRKARPERFRVATKAGRRANPHVAAAYNRENLTAFVERSLKNLDVERLDLLQLHCPPTDVYYMPEAFDALDELVRAGKLEHYGVSVERVEEALKSLEYPGVASVQIVFNMFRQRPAERFFSAAQAANVGILARLPLSSGMLTGKFTRNSRFANDDHRAFNREGQAFDRGETFSGVDYELGLAAVEELRAVVPANWSLTDLALAWILSFDAVTCAIPGARTREQAEQNARAADLPPLPPSTLAQISDIYQRLIRPLVHQRW